MKKALALLAALASVFAMNAQLVSVDVVPYELTDPASIQTEGTTTYRVYANMLNPTDEIIALFGIECSPLEISTSTAFYNASIGSVLGSDVNPSLFGIFPEIEADSWLTLGIDNLNTDGASQIGYISSIGNPFDDSFSVENGVPLLVEDGAVYINPEVAVTGIGPQNSILLGQFTTDGTLTFKLNLQVFIEGDNEQAINYRGILSAYQMALMLMEVCWDSYSTTHFAMILWRAIMPKMWTLRMWTIPLATLNPAMDAQTQPFAITKKD